MGNSPSYPDLGSLQKLPPPSYEFSVFTMSFRSHNKIFLLSAPTELIRKLEVAILTYYPEGVRTTSAWAGSHVFVLNGRPFADRMNKKEARKTVRLLCALVSVIETESWAFVTNVDLCYWKTQRTMVFRKNRQNRYNSNEVQFDNTLCVNIRATKNHLGMEQNSKLDIINGSAEIIEQCIGEKEIAKFIAIEGSDKDYALTLHGKVWKAEETQIFGYKAAMRGRCMLLEIFRRLDSLGYQFIASMTATACGDTLFFQKRVRPVTANPLATSYGLISMNKSDRLRVIRFPAEIALVINDLVKKHWPKGVVEDRPKHDKEFDCDEMKLNGRPWECRDDSETKQARFLLLKILEELSFKGWNVLCGINVTPWNLDDSTMLILRTTGERYRRAHFCVHPMSADLLWIIGADQNVLSAIRTIIRQHAPSDEVKEEEDAQNNTVAFKFTSTEPWTVNYWTESRYMLGQLVSSLDKSGWRLAFSADCSIITSKMSHGELEHKQEMDTMFFCKA